MPVLKHQFRKIRSIFASFLADEHGGVSVEFVLWMPIFATLIAGAVDISLAFMNQSNYWNVARDTARLVSRHALTAAQAEAYAESHTVFGDATPTATVTIDTNSAPQQVTVMISAPASSVDAFGIFGLFDGTTISASVKHNLEPR